MSNFRIYYNADLSGYINAFANIDPFDFTDCVDEKNLKDSIKEWIIEADLDLGDIEIDEWENFEIDLPKEFINKWKELKNE